MIATVITSIASTYGVVFLAELGDKTQLLALGFGAKYRLRTVFAGLVIGFGIAGAIAAVVGGVIGSALPKAPLAIAGGVIFLAFALWTLLDRDGADENGADENGANENGAAENGDDDRPASDAGSVGGLIARSAVIGIAASIVIGELGDKTQLATATLATQYNPFAVWLGATAGEVSAAMVGALVGNRVGTKLNPTALRYASAALFAIFGIALLYSAAG